MDPAPIAAIEFTKPKHSIPPSHAQSTPSIAKSGATAVITAPNNDEMLAFLEQLKTTIPKSAILSLTLVNPCASQKQSQPVRRLPAPLISLYSPKSKGMNKEQLSHACQDTYKGLSMTTEEADFLEQSTRLQAQSCVWFEHRKGSITTSIFAPLSRTKVDCPSLSLVKKVMQYGEKVTQKVPALKWGVDNEDRARMQYMGVLQHQHEQFECCPMGLVVNTEHPHLGVSLDGGVSCSCCGPGLLETKCPYKHRDCHPLEIVDPSFYLHNVDGVAELKRTHDCFIQIQGQMAICRRDYCDFVCWTPKGIYVEKVAFVPAVFNSIYKVQLRNKLLILAF